jgi:hypothetical protein
MMSEMIFGMLLEQGARDWDELLVQRGDSRGIAEKCCQDYLSTGSFGATLKKLGQNSVQTFRSSLMIELWKMRGSWVR